MPSAAGNGGGGFLGGLGGGCGGGGGPGSRRTAKCLSPSLDPGGVGGPTSMCCTAYIRTKPPSADSTSRRFRLHTAPQRPMVFALGVAMQLHNSIGGRTGQTLYTLTRAHNCQLYPPSIMRSSRNALSGDKRSGTRAEHLSSGKNRC